MDPPPNPIFPLALSLVLALLHSPGIRIIAAGNVNVHNPKVGQREKRGIGKEAYVERANILRVMESKLIHQDPRIDVFP